MHPLLARARRLFQEFLFGYLRKPWSDAENSSKTIFLEQGHRLATSLDFWREFSLKIQHVSSASLERVGYLLAKLLSRLAQFVERVGTDFGNDFGNLASQPA